MPNPVKDITGQRFGNLVAIEFVRPGKEDKNKIYHWKCKCDCGREILTRFEGLRKGTTKSCGCLNKNTDPEFLKKSKNGDFKTYLDRLKFRLFQRVTKTDSCWLWNEDKHSTGKYGYLKLSKHNTVNPGKVTISAHRASWIIHKGTIPEGMHVCHNCPGGDNPMCCNPDHLFLGTNKENKKDAVEKGMHYCASKKYRDPKLLDEIVNLRNSGMFCREIGEKLNIPPASIRTILDRKELKKRLVPHQRHWAPRNSR